MVLVLKAVGSLDYLSVLPFHSNCGDIDDSIKAGFIDDGSDLARLGIESHTRRDIGLISIVALGWNICNSWAAVAATMVFSIVSGGPVTLIYGIILIFLLGGCCAANMAELASAYPTAGGQYHWTGILAPRRWSRELVSLSMIQRLCSY